MALRIILIILTGVLIIPSSVSAEDSKMLKIGTGYQAEVDKDSEVRTIGGHIILEDPNKAQDRTIKTLSEQIEVLNKKIISLEEVNKTKQNIEQAVSSLKVRMQALEEQQNDLDQLLRQIESQITGEGVQAPEREE